MNWEEMELSLKKAMQKRKAKNITKTNTNYKCPRCHDNEFILTIDSEGREVAMECTCRAMREAERAFNYGNISKNFRKRNFNTFECMNSDLKAIKKYCEDYCEKLPLEKSILLSGQVGSGKSHLAFAICNKLLEANLRVYFVDYRQTITKLKQSITDGDTYGTELNKCKTAPVLFIDDLYKGKITESDVNIIYEIINYRYLNELPVIITSEKTIYEMLEIDEGIGSRIYEMTGKKILEMPSNNYRLIK